MPHTRKEFLGEMHFFSSTNPQAINLAGRSRASKAGRPGHHAGWVVVGQGLGNIKRAPNALGWHQTGRTFAVCTVRPPIACLMPSGEACSMDSGPPSSKLGSLSAGRKSSRS
jgi:hypothetical protein